MILQLLLISGIFASLLMFLGDMLLYFTTDKYLPDGTLNPIIKIMKKIPDWRLILGGIIGPIASFFYCLGFYHLTYIVTDNYYYISLITVLLCSLGMIISGAYHSHCTYLGLITKSSNPVIMEKVIRYIRLLSVISFIFLGIGLLLLGGLFLMKKTIYSSYLFFLTPLVLYFFKFLWKKLPQPLLIILYGGWYNLMFTIYFFSILLLTF